MTALATLLGCLLGVAAGALWYLAHPNQHTLAQPLSRIWRWVGHGTALASLVVLASALGIGPGLIAGLCLLQMAAMALPYLSLLRSTG